MLIQGKDFFFFIIYFLSRQNSYEMNWWNLHEECIRYFLMILWQHIGDMRGAAGIQSLF